MNKKAIITSALPYANGEIHLGHVASTYLPADVTTRFLKQNGVEAYYVCASDILKGNIGVKKFYQLFAYFTCSGVSLSIFTSIA